MSTHTPVFSRFSRWSMVLMVLVLAGCGALPPANLDRACGVFEHQRSWTRAMEHAEKKWGLPVHVQMAIIHQESKFRADARPPRRHLLWVIPWGRASSALGYAQALDSTWDWYKQKTGNRGADRTDFADSVDFVGWYARQSHKRLNLSMWDARNQYLAYHEGHGGYERGTYKRKPWLIKVAAKVAKRAQFYRQQLSSCR
ncbi:transglycosylase SLT domain-containing protein [Magnetococcus sp. PR-3]|uniref:transglycosylase SLT domain-containing protein n=1 Tax=Magnetococcus sp. PR-3 TaxID=3120355 RepID=UPI002FCDFA0D